MTKREAYDAVVIGAGFSGLYMLHLLREAGLTARVYEAGSDVGGTWYYNRYPGARCDVPTEFYCYSFSEEIYKKWTWSSWYPEQEEILNYIRFVADYLDLRKDIQFNTQIQNATYDEENYEWKIEVDDGHYVYAKYFIPALGNVTIPHKPNIKGLENFKGEMYHTSRWPHEKVDFKGKKVAVIGTGSSGVQTITEVAKHAEHVTVFQRTAQYVMPVENYELTEEDVKRMKENFPTVRKRIRKHFVGMPCFPILREYSALEDTPEERERFYEELWQRAEGFQTIFSYMDIVLDDEANKTLADFVRKKIREIVKDPQTAEDLMPSYLLGGKRPVVATKYYETFNRDNVTLVNLRRTPFVEATEYSIKTTDAEYELDMIIFASGFDAMTGALSNSNFRGRNGLTLKEKWDGGRNLKTFLGVCHTGFPNMFTITGPHFTLSANAVAANEVIAEWIIDIIKYAEEKGISEIEVTENAENEWTDHVNEVGNASIYARTNSWYVGANIEGKPRAFYGYTGDFLMYQEKFNESRHYKGFNFKLPKIAHV